MVFDINMIQKFYKKLPEKINAIRTILNRPITLTEKILYSHLNNDNFSDFKRGVDYANFNPDRVAMQDATAQMALLQFMMAGKNKVAKPTTVHCDHLIQAKVDAQKDLAVALNTNGEVYDFLESVSNFDSNRWLYKIFSV